MAIHVRRGLHYVSTWKQAVWLFALAPSRCTRDWPVQAIVIITAVVATMDELGVWRGLGAAGYPRDVSQDDHALLDLAGTSTVIRGAEGAEHCVQHGLQVAALV